MLTACKQSSITIVLNNTQGETTVYKVTVTKEILDQIRSSNLEQLKGLKQKYEGRNFLIEEAIYKRVIQIVSSK